MPSDAQIQNLRQAAAVAAAWLTSGEQAPTAVEGITIPQIDLDADEVAELLRVGLRWTADA